MLFNSVLYFIFLSITYTIYWISPEKGKKYILIIASLFFYSFWGFQDEGIVGLRWTLLFLSMITITHIANVLMFKFPEHKKKILFIEIIIVIGNLSFFKYYSFFVNILLDLNFNFEFLNISFALPLAISFYTFQILAYSIDIYRKNIQEKKSFFDYLLFIAFFPQLIAGPIMRFTDFFNQKPALREEYIYRGLWLILSGLFKKILIADPMGNLISPVFLMPNTYSFEQILLGGFGFSIQVYCDFSGYTDLARGSAYLFGYQIPENFLAPFFSRSARELWQRWHITLATWLRDYIYIPLGGSKISEIRTYINQIITFSLGGLWHGADYTYIVWGTMWGVLLAIERFFENVLKIKTVPQKNIILIVLKVLLIMYFFILGALMFRSQDVMLENHKIRSVEIMMDLLKGSYINHSNKLKNEFIEKNGDYEFIEKVMGKNFLEMNKINFLDQFFLLMLLTIFFHIIQYKQNLFIKLEKYNFYLLLLAYAIVLGFLIPAFSLSGHQFIYFVF